MAKRRWFSYVSGAVAAVVFLCGAQVASAAFVLVEDFQGLNLGALGSQNGWTSADNNNVVAAQGSNKFLSTDTTGAGDDSDIFKSLPLANGTTGTLFGRFYMLGSASDMSFGMSDQASPSGFASFEAQLSVNAGKLRGRDGSGFTTAFESGGGNEADVAGGWYNFWMVINNAADTTQVYIQSDTDSDFSTQQLMAPTLDFRNGTGDSLVNLYLRVDVSGNTEGMLFDDFYFDATGSNLDNPVLTNRTPEPTSLVLWLSLGMVGSVFGYRRRR